MGWLHYKAVLMWKNVSGSEWLPNESEQAWVVRRATATSLIDTCTLPRHQLVYVYTFKGFLTAHESYNEAKSRGDELNLTRYKGRESDAGTRL